MSAAINFGHVLHAPDDNATGVVIVPAVATDLATLLGDPLGSGSLPVNNLLLVSDDMVDAGNGNSAVAVIRIGGPAVGAGDPGLRKGQSLSYASNAGDPVQLGDIYVRCAVAGQSLAIFGTV